MINWIAVEDRLPQDMHWVLGWTRFDGKPFIVQWNVDRQYWFDMISAFAQPWYTHWAELSDLNPPGEKE